VAKLFTLYMKQISLKYLWQVLVLSLHALNNNAVDNDNSAYNPHCSPAQ
jgi:hypothetical protein